MRKQLKLRYPVKTNNVADSLDSVKNFSRDIIKTAFYICGLDI